MDIPVPGVGRRAVTPPDNTAQDRNFMILQEPAPETQEFYTWTFRAVILLLNKLSRGVWRPLMFPAGVEKRLPDFYLIRHHEKCDGVWRDVRPEATSLFDAY